MSSSKKDNKLKFEDYDLGKQNEIQKRLKDLADYEKINVRFVDDKEIQKALEDDSI